MLKIGITGGIGCGKSEVCKLLKKSGIPIINADLVARKIIDNNDKIKSKLKKSFGDNVYLPDGRLDRKRVAQIIFKDEAAKNRINKIVHPHVIEFQKRALQKLEKSGKFKIAGVEAALIYEAGSETQFDVVVVVSVSQDTVIQRLVKRSGLSGEEILNRIKSQLPLSEKINRADYVINNDGSIEDLKDKVKNLLCLLKNRE